MNDSHCPNIEELLMQLDRGEGFALEHASGCERCQALLEAHRDLDRQLARLVDPLPPPDFVAQVMKSVEKLPAPAPVPTGLGSGLWILTAALATSVFTLALGGYRLTAVLSSLGTTLLVMKSAWVGFSAAFDALWTIAALPLAVAVAVGLMFALYVLDRLSTRSTREVTP